MAYIAPVAPAPAPATATASGESEQLPANDSFSSHLEKADSHRRNAQENASGSGETETTTTARPTAETPAADNSRAAATADSADASDNSGSADASGSSHEQSPNHTKTSAVDETLQKKESAEPESTTTLRIAGDSETSFFVRTSTFFSTTTALNLDSAVFTSQSSLQLVINGTSVDSSALPSFSSTLMQNRPAGTDAIITQIEKIIHNSSETGTVTIDISRNSDEKKLIAPGQKQTPVLLDQAADGRQTTQTLPLTTDRVAAPESLAATPVQTAAEPAETAQTATPAARQTVAAVIQPESSTGGRQSVEPAGKESVIPAVTESHQPAEQVVSRATTETASSRPAGDQTASAGSRNAARVTADSRQPAGSEQVDVRSDETDETTGSRQTAVGSAEEQNDRTGRRNRRTIGRDQNQTAVETDSRRAASPAERGENHSSSRTAALPEISRQPSPPAAPVPGPTDGGLFSSIFNEGGLRAGDDSRLSASAAATQTLPSGRVVREQDIFNQFSERFQITSRNMETKVNIRLNPRELGELKLDITVREGAIRANVFAQSEIARTVIEKNVGRLKTVLEQQGFTVEEITVTAADRALTEFALFDDNSPEDNAAESGYTAETTTFRNPESADNSDQVGVDLAV